MHFGSLVAALASYLDARTAAGQWLLRMDDLDPPREVPGAASDILATLDAFGFEWDGSVLYQSSRTDAYTSAIEQLASCGLVFPCACSRSDLAEAGQPGVEGRIYPGTCRTGLPPGRRARSLRIRAEGQPIAFQDRIQGALRQDLAQEIGDFVLRRADGIPAYQLAVVVDDSFQDITQVVRGADLVLSTPRQIFLQQALDMTTPRYAHLPLAVDEQGRKLSKSVASAPVDPDRPLPALLQAWEFLDQTPFPERPANRNEFWAHTLEAWNPARVPAQRSRPLPGSSLP